MYFLTYNHLYLMCLITNFFFVLKMKFTCTNLFIDQLRDKKSHQETKNLQKQVYIYNFNKFTQCILPKINVKK